MAAENSVAAWALAILPRLRRVSRALTGDKTSADLILGNTMREFDAQQPPFDVSGSHQLLLTLLQSLVAAWLLQPIPNLRLISVSDDLDQLDAHLQSLPRLARCVYVLIRLEQLSLEEVAEVMQIRPATVAALAERAAKN